MEPSLWSAQKESCLPLSPALIYLWQQGSGKYNIIMNWATGWSEGCTTIGVDTTATAGILNTGQYWWEDSSNENLIKPNFQILWVLPIVLLPINQQLVSSVRSECVQSVTVLCVLCTGVQLTVTVLMLLLSWALTCPTPTQIILYQTPTIVSSENWSRMGFPKLWMTIAL